MWFWWAGAGGTCQQDMLLPGWSVVNKSRALFPQPHWWHVLSRADGKAVAQCPLWGRETFCPSYKSTVWKRLYKSFINFIRFFVFFSFSPVLLRWFLLWCGASGCFIFLGFGASGGWSRVHHIKLDWSCLKAIFIENMSGTQWHTKQVCNYIDRQSPTIISQWYDITWTFAIYLSTFPFPLLPHDWGICKSLQQPRLVQAHHCSSLTSKYRKIADQSC